MNKKKLAIGIDVGMQSIKMAFLSLSGRNVEILDYKLIDLFNRKKKSGEAIDEIVDSINSIISKKKTFGQVDYIPVIVSAEGSNVFIRVFKLPGVAKSKLTKIIEYEAQQQVPFPINQVIWDYQCLRMVSPEETDVVLLAIKDAIINDFLSSLDLRISSVVPPVIGLSNFIDWYDNLEMGGVTGQAVMLLDLGAKTTNVVIMEGKAIWFRTIPLGGELITHSICSEYGIAFNEAEALKRSKGEIILSDLQYADTDRKRLSTCIIKSLTRLAGEISRSNEVYSSSFNSLGPRKILLTGGGSKLRNIEEFLSKKLRVDVSKLEIDRIVNVAPDLNRSGFKEDSRYIGPALGLGIQGLGLARVKVSLLPKEVIKKNTWFKRQTHLIAISLLLIFLGIGFSVYNLQIAGIYNTSANNLASERKAIEINKKALSGNQEKYNDVWFKLSKVDEVSKARKFWLEFFIELEEIMPANLWLTGIRYRKINYTEDNFSKRNTLFIYDDYIVPVVNLKLTGKTTGTYGGIVAFRDALNSSDMIVADSGKVISANPPEKGIRDFEIEVEAKIFQSDENNKK